MSSEPSSFADITTFRVGGAIGDLTVARTRGELLDFARAHPVDSEQKAVFVGGGSNLLVADSGYTGPTCLVRTRGVDIRSDGTVTGQAGVTWDDFVARCVDAGLTGLEALSGIPGSVGATPIQNVGAYGAEVADTLREITVFDRVEARERTLTRGELRFGYRNSVLKETAAELGQSRYVVLDVTFGLEPGTESAPVRYAQLAGALGVEIGQRVPAELMRDTVLALRSSKGMVLDAADHDSWSAGSFFTNPILEAGEKLPEGAPRYPVRDSLTGQIDPDRVKTSAAWLIEHAGFEKGFALNDRASLSTKHTLALTNRGSAAAGDIVELARHIREGVMERYGIRLHPEPNILGVSI